MNEVETKGREAAAAGATNASEAGRPAARVEASTSGPEGSFGRALAAAREARGMTHADIASQLRLSTRQIKAIEAEDLAALPAGPFVRGYLRNYARLVDLPAEPLLSMLNARLRPAEPLRVEAGTSTAVSPIQRVPGEPTSGRLVIGAAVAALLVFAAFGWWTLRGDSQKAPAARPDAAPAVAAEPAAPAPTTSAEPPAAATAVSPSPPAVVGEPATAVSGTALRLNFRDRSWVEIRQADGTVLLSQNNAPGTTQTIDGVPPYTLVIGNASKVDLEFRGQAVDLGAATSRDDVARLRLE